MAYLVGWVIFGGYAQEPRSLIPDIAFDWLDEIVGLAVLEGSGEMGGFDFLGSSD